MLIQPNTLCVYNLQCSRKANTCGKCLDGYTATSDDETLETNEPCVKLEPATEGII